MSHELLFIPFIMWEICTKATNVPGSTMSTYKHWITHRRRKEGSWLPHLNHMNLSQNLTKHLRDQRLERKRGLGEQHTSEQWQKYSQNVMWAIVEEKIMKKCFNCPWQQIEQKTMPAGWLIMIKWLNASFYQLHWRQVNIVVGDRPGSIRQYTYIYICSC